MADNEKTYSVFLKKLIDNSMSPKRYAAYYRSVTDPSLMTDPGSLYNILCLEKKHLSEIASKSLEVLEHEDNFKPPWIDLKWKLSAYLAVQDVFPNIIDSPRRIAGATIGAAAERLVARAARDERTQRTRHDAIRRFRIRHNRRLG